MEKEPVITKVRRETESIEGIAGEIESISSAFCQTGNYELGSNLYDISQRLLLESEKIIKILSDKINEDLKNINLNFTETIKALAGKDN